MDGRLTPPWQPWEAIPVVLAAVAASFVVSVALAVASGGPGGSTILLTAVAFQAALVGFTVLWVAVRYRGWVPALGLRSRRAGRDVALGAWTGAALFGATAFILLPAIVVLWRALTGGAPPPIEQPVLPVDPTPSQIVLGVLAVVLAAPIGEEVFFRGFLFRSLRGRMGFTVSAAISAAVFAVFHAIPLLIALMFFVGMALAYLFERRGSLAAPITAHAVFNLIGYALILMQRLQP